MGRTRTAHSFRRRLIESEERGASAVEYALLIAGVSAVIVLAVLLFGGTIKSVLFDDTCQEISEKVTADCED